MLHARVGIPADSISKSDTRLFRDSHDTYLAHVFPDEHMWAGNHGRQHLYVLHRPSVQYDLSCPSHAMIHSHAEFNPDGAEAILLLLPSATVLRDIRQNVRRVAQDLDPGSAELTGICFCGVDPSAVHDGGKHATADKSTSTALLDEPAVAPAGDVLRACPAVLADNCDCPGVYTPGSLVVGRNKQREVPASKFSVLELRSACYRPA